MFSFWLGGLPTFRIALFAAGCLGNPWLLFHQKLRSAANFAQKANFAQAMLLAAGLITTIWTPALFVW